MTDDTYELDALGASARKPDGASGDGADGDGVPEEPLGLPVPEEHVGAFVAEAFEDAERDTAWADVVDAVVAPEAREAWEALSAREQAVEVLEMAADYDRRAAETLEAVPLGEGADVSERVTEAKRLRRNADVFRDGVAAAYRAGRLDDEDLVAAVEEAGFDSEAVARREELLERVANAHGIDFRPYGGTLLGDSDRETATPTGTETW